MSFKRKKILVTGGAGFIGSNIVDGYIKEGHKVLIIDNLITGNKENINPKADFEKIDITDFKRIKKIYEKFKPDILNHHAAQIDIRRSVSDPIFDAQVNILGTINLLNCCVEFKTKKIIFASSGGAIYGEIKEKKGANENHIQNPISPYAISKKSAELYIISYFENFSMEYTILRYANVYGPRQDPKGEAGVVCLFIDKIDKGQRPIIFGTGRQLRDYVYVGDVVDVNILVLNKGGNKIYNIATEKGTSVLELFQCLAETMSFKKKPKFAPPRKGELFRSVLNCSKIKKELKWQAKIDLKEGFRRTVKYFYG